MNNTESRIEVLKDEINVRQVELKLLIRESMENEKDPLKRFQTWANNGLEKNHDSYLPGGAIRAWVDEHLDLGCMRGSVEILDYEPFCIAAMTDEELIKTDCQIVFDDLRKDTLFIAACEHMVESNLGCFSIDW